MTKRTLIACLVFVSALAFAAGYTVAQRVGHAKVAAAIEPVAPAINNLLAGMTEEDVRNLLNQIRDFSSFAVAESDQQVLFDAATANRLLAYRERGDESAVWSFLEERLDIFRERHESGEMKIGDKKALADAIYKRIKQRKNEPNKTMEPTPVSVTIPAAQEVAPLTSVAHLER